MSDDNIIKLQNYKEVQEPQIRQRCGTVYLNFGLSDTDTIEIDGSITLSEVCFLHAMLGHWIQERFKDE